MSAVAFGLAESNISYVIQGFIFQGCSRWGGGGGA